MKSVRFRDSAGVIREGEWNDTSIDTTFRSYAPETVEILPPCEPTKIIAVGKNYEEKFKKTENTPPAYPRLFYKPPHTVVGHGKTVELPLEDTDVIFEAELGVVIDTQCKRVPKENAAAVVRGYTCVNDITNRDVLDFDPGRVRAKGFDNAAPIGPVIASPESVPDRATIELRLNGETKQQSTIDGLVYSIPELIEAVTKYVTLEPGDVISTGTPLGTGRLRDGDDVEVEIEGIGVLEHDVVRTA